MMMPHHLIERILKIRLLIVDVDGVLTDGRIIYDSRGNQLKFFDVLDGFGIHLLRTAGIETAIITAKKSKVVMRRAKDFKVKHIYQDCIDKIKAFHDVSKKLNVDPEEVCFIGDDIVDIPVLKRVGFAVSVPNAVDEAKEISHYITRKEGGHGAVREVCDLIMKAQGKWDGVISRYTR
jgi:3-deoxy-D-manno-octulosonate 8-phosphate phosphatase (KDO 8-P phosphatase)